MNEKFEGDNVGDEMESTEDTVESVRHRDIKVTSTKVKDPITGKEVPRKEAVKLEFVYELGADLDEALELHGEEAVYNMFIRGAVVAVQNAARIHANSGKEDSIQELMDDYKLGEHVTADTRTPKQIAMDFLRNCTPEEREAYFAEVAVD